MREPYKTPKANLGLFLIRYGLGVEPGDSTQKCFLKSGIRQVSAGIGVIQFTERLSRKMVLEVNVSGSTALLEKKSCKILSRRRRKS